MNKKVSIVAPAYNHAQYIGRCLESIANQNWDDMELIIIDDCSNDETPSIIKRYVNDKGFDAKFKGRITFIEHKTNKGAFFSLNEGLHRASGNYITMINTDDYYGDQRIKHLMDSCMENQTEFVFGRINVVDQNDQSVQTGYGKEIMKYQDLIEKCPTVSMALTRGNATISTGNMLFTKRLYDKLDGFGNYKYVHDWDFALRASLLSEPVFDKNAVYYYRIHTDNTIAEISKKNKNPDSLEKPVNGKRIGINPLVKHFISIIKGEYSNKKIPSKKVWEYFVYNKKYYYDDDNIVWAWNEAIKSQK